MSENITCLYMHEGVCQASGEKCDLCVFCIARDRDAKVWGRPCLPECFEAAPDGGDTDFVLPRAATENIAALVRGKDVPNRLLIKTEE